MNIQPNSKSPPQPLAPLGQDALRLLIEHVKDYAIFMLDIEGYVLSWNPGAERIKGYHADEIIGQHFSRFYPQADLDCGKPKRALEVAAAEGQFVDEDWRVRKDGSRFMANVIVTALRDETGQLRGFGKVTRDITERKQAEEGARIHAELLNRQARMLEFAHVLAWEPGGGITFWNKGAEQLYGWSNDETIGRISHQLLKTQFPKPRQEIMAEILDRGEWQGELIHETRAGQLLTVSSRWILQKDARTSQLLIVEVNNDITARKRAEEEVVRLNTELDQRVRDRTAQLEAANKELEAFSYSVSHDLRAPLRGVDGFIRMLQEDCADQLNAEGHRLLGVVSSEAKRMGQLIDDLLAFSRIGRQEMQRSTVDMTQLAGSVFERLSVAAPGGARRFELKPLPQTKADPAMLRQVFVNLLGNAIKFTRLQPSPLIEVGSFDRDGRRIYYVKDNGAGFEEKYSHKLFGVFQRLHSEEEFEGTGVGLALVQRIVHRHGGDVWAEGKPGKGATFYFTLPS